MSLATLKPIALTHICANYTYNHVLYDVCTQTGCINVQTINYKLLLQISASSKWSVNSR